MTNSRRSPSDINQSDSVLSSNSSELVSDLAGKNQTNADGTRNRLANSYVLGYLIIVGIVLLIGYLKNWPTSDYKDLLLATSGILSGPLGFIVGFYFKSAKDF